LARRAVGLVKHRSVHERAQVGADGAIRHINVELPALRTGQGSVIR
jgi:hypothetical protein